MTTDHDARTRIVLSWLRGDAHENAERVLLRALDEVDSTAQRRPIWPVRRFEEMSSSMRVAAAVVAAAVLIAAGMAFAFAGGLTPKPSTAPLPTATPAAGTSAPSASPLPGEFTACVPPNAEFKTGTDDYVADGQWTVQRRRGFTWKGDITATDPRFSGTHYYSWDGNTYALTSGDAGPHTYAEGHRIENADGAWVGSSVGAEIPGGTSANGPVVLKGEGAYEGLSAVLLNADGPCFFNFRGMLLQVPDPPVPYTGK